MKKVFYVFLGAAFIGMLAAGVTTYVLSSNTDSKDVLINHSAFTNSGMHFTSYEKEKYPDLTYAAENAVRAVVNIENIQEVQSSASRGRSQGGFEQFFEYFGLPQGYGGGSGSGQGYNAPRERRSGGSGVIISSDGYIVTNNHVVDKATKLKVKLNDNRTYDAKLIGTDPTTDIALIKIEQDGLPTLNFGDSDLLRLGEWVLAIGSPFDLQSTVTAGIVSAKARNLDVIPDQFRIESFIQTDAAVNPGNSGGALVNTAGELIGINTVIKSPTGSYTGYSFAVPSSIVSKIVIDLKEFGMVQRALLGVQFQEINSSFIETYGEEYGITEQGGVYVNDVTPDGAAKDAGIKKGDIITQIDEVKIDGSSQLQEQIAKHRPNEKVKVYIKRDGQMKQFDVVLRNKAGKAELLSSDYVDVINVLGGSFAEVNTKTKKELKINGGIQVVGIEEDGILSQARVRKGYIITHINDRAINSIADVSRITEKVTSIDGVYPDGRSVSYSLYRDND